MTVSYSRQGVVIPASAVVCRAARPDPRGRSAARPPAIDDVSGRRGCRVEGYLQRKLHRQWRNRGS